MANNHGMFTEFSGGYRLPGDTFHKELPAEADKGLVPLAYEGVEVRRIRSIELESEETADAAVREFIKFMARRKESR